MSLDEQKDPDFYLLIASGVEVIPTVSRIISNMLSYGFYSVSNFKLTRWGCLMICKHMCFQLAG
jgi:hypothetical protein